MATRFGKAIRFKEEDVRASNRGTMGVKAISLNMGDELISMDVIRPSANFTLLTITNQGYGKRTELEEYPQQRRGGSGVSSGGGALAAAPAADLPQQTEKKKRKHGLACSWPPA